MQTAILTLHVIVCLVLVILVLLQAGREGMGVIFGGGGNSSVFGSAGAGGVLVKLTTFMAVLFLITSLGYNIMTGTKRDKGSTILDVQFEESMPVDQAPSLPISQEEGSSLNTETENQTASEVLEAKTVEADGLEETQEATATPLMENSAIEEQAEAMPEVEEPAPPLETEQITAD